MPRPRFSKLGVSSVVVAAVGFGAVVYNLRVEDTVPVAVVALGAGPVAFVLAAFALFNGRASRAVAALGLVLASLLMSGIGYVLWWVTTQSA